METLNHAYLDIDKFPANLNLPGIYPYQLDEYRVKLDQNAPRLFCSETDAAVDILQLDEGQKGKFPNLHYCSKMLVQLI